MLTTVVIPVKTLETTKSRLSAILDKEQRRFLSEKMLLHVLRASCGPGVREQVVVTSDHHVARLAEEQGSIPVLEEGNGLNRALSQATRYLVERGGSSILILPSDLPFITDQDVEAILNLAKDEQAIVISPCHRGNGTNALLVKPPGILEYAFGEQSFQRHKKKALQCGVNPAIYYSRSVGFDLDLPEDFHYYLEHGDETGQHSYCSGFAPYQAWRRSSDDDNRLS